MIKQKIHTMAKPDTAHKLGDLEGGGGGGVRVCTRVILAGILLLLKGSLKFRLIKDTAKQHEFAPCERF